MIWLALALLAAHPHPSGAVAPPSLSQREREQPASGGRKGEGERAAAIDAVARATGLAGEVLVAKGDRVLLDRGYGPIAPRGGAQHKAGERWRLASITKQVAAALIVRQQARRGVSLDQPIGSLSGPDYAKPFVDFLAPLTIRQLLTHHSGLANPDDTPPVGGAPGFYTRAAPDLAYCRSRAPAPGAAFRYNNCDYLLLGALLHDRFAWPAGMQLARAGETGVPGFVHDAPEPSVQLTSYGPSGGLMGTLDAVFRFDRSLLAGRLLAPAQRAALWQPEGGTSYQALGQWVFPGQLKGCAAPKRIVQRDGEIYGVQARNYIFPDDDLVVIVFTNRSSDDFKLGEVWEGRGFVYDLLSAAAC